MTSTETELDPKTTERKLSIDQFTFLFKRHWWVVALTAALVGCISLLYCLVQTPLYVASAKMYVTSGTDADAMSAYQGSLASQQRVASYAELVDSDVILSDALNNSGLQISIGDARELVSATSNTDTVLLAISAENRDPAVAASLANRVAESMTRYVTQLEKPNDTSPPLAKLTVVSPATPPQAPFFPRTTWNTLLGMLVGALLGIIIAYGRERMDTRLRNREQVQSSVATSVLAEIPAEVSLDKHPIVDFAVGSSRASEGYRRLRTNLAFVRVDEPPRCIAVTSPGAGEGKTTTSINLAAALAEDGHSVVLVDADLRRPSVAGRLGLAEAVGLTSFLRSEGTVLDFVQRGPVDGLDVLVAGALPPNPAELLGSLRAQEGIAALRARYDYVIVDTPPILPVADAAILSQFVDGVLMVVRAGGTRSQDLANAYSSLVTARAFMLGVVLNGVPAHESRYLYYSYNNLGTATGSSASGTEQASVVDRVFTRN